MEAGLAAPSGCNTQTTSLICVDDPDVLKKVKESMKSHIATTAPAIICVLTQRVPGYDDVYFNIQDYSAAIENMLLAAVALGYESLWIEGQVTSVDRIGTKIADALDVPAGYDLVCLLPIGIAGEPTKFPTKKAFEERAWFNGFKTK
jgi:nitroreductase